ncbi:MAG: nucleoside triphosphate pyrophosphohydrolase [Leptospirillia bacterium]
MTEPVRYPERARGAAESFLKLVELVAVLRGPDGCPWDRAQSRESVSPYLIEEAYEVLDAIRSGDPAQLREELGDLLFQVLFHADMSAEAGDFSVAQVCDDLRHKMVHRHPHVFGDGTASTPEEVLADWEKVKSKEKGKAGRTSILDGVPKSAPPLLRAADVSKRAARAGFDWEQADHVWAKVHEEMDELKEATAAGDMAAAQDELGDLFFALVNLARKLDLSAEEAITSTVERFVRRFRHMEQGAPKALNDLTAEEWQGLWQQAKQAERDA